MMHEEPKNLPFTIHEERLAEHRALLYIQGRLDAVTAPALKAHLKRLIQEGYTQLILDFRTVPFIDSSGLAALVSALKLIRESGGALKLACLTRQTRMVFELTLLDRIFEFYDSVDAAIASLKSD
jgi:anti-sigma B factor antagonist